MDSVLYRDIFDVEERHWWHRAKRRACLWLVTQYTPRPNPKILDYGCGAGANLAVLSRLGEAHGVDFSREAVSLCQDRGLRNVRKCELNRTDLPDHSFDVITLLDVLEHADEALLLAEVRRLLRLDGIVVINVPAFRWLWSRWDDVLQHKRRYTQRALRETLEREGFAVLRLSYLFSFLVLPLLIVHPLKAWIFRGKDYPSDNRISSPLLNWAVNVLTWLEFQWFRHFPIPFGSSVICVAGRAT